jgi:hypothetical protein
MNRLKFHSDCVKPTIFKARPTVKKGITLGLYRYRALNCSNSITITNCVLNLAKKEAINPLN